MTLDAAQHRSGKGSGDENFPVASWLVPPPYRRPILAFYEFVRIADDVADHVRLAAAEKLRMLDALKASLLGHAERTGVRREQGADLPRQIEDRRLALEISAIVTLARHFVKLLRSRDPLSETVRLSKLGVAAVGALGAAKGLFGRLGRASAPI